MGLIPVATGVFETHCEAVRDYPRSIGRVVIQPPGTGVMGKSFDAVIGPVWFLDVGAMHVESPRSQQLKRLCRHFHDEFVRQIASSETRVVVYSENVHSGFEQVSLV